MPFKRNAVSNLLRFLLVFLFIAQANTSQADPSTDSPSPADIPAKAEDVHPIMVGQMVPDDIQIRDIDGNEIKLNDVIKKKPTLLIFYRGSWCPYCNTHLAALRDIERPLEKMGFQIIALSPDLPEYLKKSTDKFDLKYKLYSDAAMNAAKALGLAYEVDEKTRDLYVDYGIDLEKNSGQSHHLLPVPAAILVNPFGKVTFTFVAPDYKVRVENDVLLAAAKAQQATNSKQLPD